MQYAIVGATLTVTPAALLALLCCCTAAVAAAYLICPPPLLTPTDPRGQAFCRGCRPPCACARKCPECVDETAGAD